MENTAFLILTVLVGLVIILILGRLVSEVRGAVLPYQAAPVGEVCWHPGLWHPVLVQYFRYYRALGPGSQVAFREMMEAFLNHVCITPVGFPTVERDYIFIAASAVIPVFHKRRLMYPQLKEIIVHPSTFGTFADSEGQHRYTAGLTGTGRYTGVVYLARNVLWKDVLEQRCSNVAIHEFIHVLDQADGRIDGLPAALMHESAVEPWITTMMHEMKTAHQTDQELDTYAFESPAEFLAVISEYYFARPDLMQERHPELYGMMCRVYGAEA